MMKILILADPISSLKPEFDTSLYFLRLGCERGAWVYWAEPRDLRWVGSSLEVTAQGVEAPGDLQTLPTMAASREFPVTNFDWVCIRKTPPFDLEFLKMLWLLTNVPKDSVRMFNSPQALLLHHEKNIPLQMLAEGWLTEEEVIPTCWSPRTSDWQDFMKSFPHPYWITKVWNSFGGQDVQRWKREDLSASLIEEGVDSSQFLQPYFSEVETSGDLRVLILNGEVMGAFTRTPKEGGYLANLIHGAKAWIRDLSPQEEAIVSKLCRWAKKKRVDFLGIDVIANRLNEVNVTCPTGVHVFEKLSGRSCEDAWWKFFAEAPGEEISE